MKRVDWSKDLITEVKKKLTGYYSVKAALPVIKNLVDPHITEGQLRDAFRRWGEPRPSTFCRPVDSKTKINVPPGLIPRTQEPEVFSTTSQKKIPKSLIIDGDTHYPIHDPYVEAAKLKFAQDVKPGMWINLGDCYDFWPISSHEKEPERWFDGKSRLQDEFDSAQPYWKEVCRVTQGPVELIPGNHENRLYRLIGANLGLFNLRAFEWQTLAGLPDKVTVHKYGTAIKVGPVTTEHGDKYWKNGMGPKHPAQWLLDNKGNRTTVFGHTHRFNVASRTIYDECGEPHSYVALNQGHGSDVKKQKYIYEPSWQHGFTYIEYWTERNKIRFTIYPILIINGKFSFGGKVYDGRKL